MGKGQEGGSCGREIWLVKELQQNIHRIYEMIKHVLTK